MNPVDEFLVGERLRNKEAAELPRFMPAGTKKQVLTLAAASILPTLAITGVNAAIREVKKAVTRSRDFKNMMEANPDLGDREAEGVKSLFSLIHDTSPTLAANPLVAGGFIRKLEHGKNYLDAGIATDLATAEAQIQRNRQTGAEPYLRTGSDIAKGLRLLGPQIT